MTNKSNDKSSWAIGGMLLICLGVGFIFLQSLPLFFIASIFIGIVLALLISLIISGRKGQ